MRRGWGLASSTALWQVIAIAAGFAILGIGAGWLWTVLWSPAHGEVYQHVWYPYSWDRAQPATFEAVGVFASVGVLLGLVLGGIAVVWLDASVLASVCAVIVGGVLAAVTMRAIGLHLGPADPQIAAKSAANGTVLSSQIVWGGWPLYGVVAFGGVLPWVPSLLPRRYPRRDTPSDIQSEDGEYIDR